MVWQHYALRSDCWMRSILIPSSMTSHRGMLEAIFKVILYLSVVAYEYCFAYAVKYL
jgi:hypothetical protein